MSALKNATKSLENKTSKNIKKYSKTFCQYAEDELKYKDKILKLINEDSHLAKDDMEAADVLKKYLASVFNKENCISVEKDCKSHLNQAKNQP